jgi:hypothetical protein
MTRSFFFWRRNRNPSSLSLSHSLSLPPVSFSRKTNKIDFEEVELWDGEKN